MITPEHNLYLTEKEIVSLANDIWKIEKHCSKITDLNRKAAIKFSLMNIKQILKNYNVSMQNITGKEFKEGLSVDIINIYNKKENGSLYIEEMIEPIVYINGKVHKKGKVILEYK